MTFSTHLESIVSHTAALLRRMGIPSGTLGIMAHPKLANAGLWEQQGYSPVFLNPGEKPILSSPAAFVALNLAALPDEAGALNRLHTACMEHKVPLAVAAVNLAHNDSAFALLGGHSEEGVLDKASPDFAAYTQQRLAQVTARHGFAPLEQNDVVFDAGTQFQASENILIQPGALSHQYLQWLKGWLDSTGPVWCFVRGYTAASIIPGPGEPRQDRPFLSVVTRTQGTRPDELREVLLCLNAQTDKDFEILVVGHKVTPENKQSVLDLIDETPPSLRRKIRYLEADASNRSAPLNLGFSEAKGQYISILDDDDLVMDHWVETFHKQAGKTPGAMLHAYCVDQEWSRGTDGTLFAINKPGKKYCKSFDYVHQTVENFCPTMSLAFPGWLFQNSSLRFDETLNTTEDWDFIMRVVFITGVADIPEITSVYRLWKNAESSHQLHDDEHWRDNYNVVKKRMNSAPVLLPPESAKLLDKYYRIGIEYEQMCNPKGGEGDEEAILYLDVGNGLNEQDTLVSLNKGTPNALMYTYDLPEALRQVQMVRFDPRDDGDITLQKVEVHLVGADGGRTRIAPGSIGSNGFSMGDSYCFMEDDPQVLFPVPAGSPVHQIEICCTLTDGISPLQLQNLRNNYNALQMAASQGNSRNLLPRIKRKLRRMLGR